MTTFETKNTRLAAALLAMGFKIVGQVNFRVEVVTFPLAGERFVGMSPEDYDRAWRDTGWARQHPQHPFTAIRKVAEARDWIVGRVVHGGHNFDIESDDGSDFTTRNLNLASCLVADGFYLIRLDPLTREFHFPAVAQSFNGRFKEHEAESAIEWQLRYLQKFNWLRRCIKQHSLCPECSQNNTRHWNRTCVTSLAN